jgi:hypothetical protein
MVNAKLMVIIKKRRRHQLSVEDKVFGALDLRESQRVVSLENINSLIDSRKMLIFLRIGAYVINWWRIRSRSRSRSVSKTP